MHPHRSVWTTPPSSSASEVFDGANGHARALSRETREVLDSISHPVGCLDAAGAVRGVNAAWSKDTAIAPLPLGERYPELTGPGGGKPFAELTGHLEQLLAGHRHHVRQTVAVHEPDRERWYQVDIAPVSRRTGVFIAEHRDVTRHVQHERLERLLVALQPRGRRDIGATAATIARELGWSGYVVWERRKDDVWTIAASADADDEALARTVDISSLAQGTLLWTKLAQDCTEALAAIEEPNAGPSVTGFAVALRGAGDRQRVVAFYGPAAAPPDEACRRLCENALAEADTESGTAPASIPDAGNDPMVNVRRLIARACSSEATVLLLGESGTGKTRVARSIHEQSCRADRPFLDLNCAGLGPTLLESELFGHERGAFTGANQRKLGLLELSTGGTVLLDEIGELDPAVQAKLLKVLETRRFRRVGGSAELSLDVRFIAATNRDLKHEIAQGRFRQDLYYRLNVIEIEIPPLRDRSTELVPMATELLEEIADSHGASPKQLNAGAQKALRDYRWPGNIRELRNILERAALGDADVIEESQLREVLPLPAHAPREPNPAPSLRSLAERERLHLLRVLEETGFNMRKSASILGVARSTLYEMCRRHRLDVREMRRRQGGAR